MAEKYNGWENRATWLVLLWISNEEEGYKRWDGVACRAVQKFGTFREATYELAQYLKEEYTEAGRKLSPGAGFWNDLISGELSNINWDEIASHLVADCGEEEWDEEEEDEEEEDEG